jgi:hypothetical protein
MEVIKAGYATHINLFKETTYTFSASTGLPETVVKSPKRGLLCTLERTLFDGRIVATQVG